MTVTAATALFVVVVMTATLVIATLMVATFVIMATAPTSACEMLDEVLYLFLRGLTVLHDLSCEVQ